jgi:hypothetical protein
MISQPIPFVNNNGKAEHIAPELSQYEQRMRVLELTLQLLIIRTTMGDYWPDGLRDVGKFLAALPLQTTDFTAATSHLLNAVDYCQRNEFGAATFELRALRGQLQRL